jgi:hypothetical protein
VYVLLKMVKLGSPLETVYIAEQVSLNCYFMLLMVQPDALLVAQLDGTAECGLCSARIFPILWLVCRRATT